MNKKVLIYGHKNPDTDSICGAIAMAYLKNQSDDGYEYTPMAAGNPNSETAYVLERFDINVPEVRNDIRKQISDMELDEIYTVDESTSINNVWNLMHKENIYTVPIIEREILKGIVTVGDIARSYMKGFDRESLGKARTPLKNIVDVLDGDMILQCSELLDDGTIMIVTENQSNDNIKEGDICILSDNNLSQKSLIEKRIGLMVLANGAKPNADIEKLAKENNVSIITTANDLYKTARTINQSIPVSYIMRTAEEVVTVNVEDFIDDVKNIMNSMRFRSYPVMKDNKVVGIIGKSSLVDPVEKNVIMVDHNESTQGVFGITEANIIEIVDHHKLGTIETMQPINVTNKPLGSTCSIITQKFLENDIEIPKNIAGILLSAILSDTMLFKSPTCTPIDVKLAEMLAEKAQIDTKELWENMLKASLDLESKTEEEIFYQDYKNFEENGFKFGAGQVLAANNEDVENVKKRLIPYMNSPLNEQGLDMVCLMITNVAEDSSELIFAGENAKNILESAFGKKEKENGIYLEGVVSRKKQLIPPIMAILKK